MENKIICPKCKSKETIKRGIRKTNRGNVQRFGCKKCNHRFVVDNAFFRMRNHKQKITLCLDLYYKGLSLRKIQKHLKVFYPHNSHYSTIYRWIIKYVEIMKDFTEKQKIDNSISLQGDEVEYHRRKYRNRKGVDKNWFVDVIDTKTRYLVSSAYLPNREFKSMKRVWSKAKNKTGDSVKYISTDGLYIYTKVLKHTFNLKTRHRKPTKTSKVFHNVIKSTSGNFNYKIERFHNTLRERTKIMRGFHGCMNSASLIMKGFEIYYNWIREHSSLNKTPSDVAVPTFQFQNDNRWLELINLGYEK